MSQISLLKEKIEAEISIYKGEEPREISLEEKVSLPLPFSKLYTYLEREETKVWQYSSLMLAELFNEERSGRLVLPEV